MNAFTYETANAAAHEIEALVPEAQAWYECRFNEDHELVMRVACQMGRYVEVFTTPEHYERWVEARERTIERKGA